MKKTLVIKTGATGDVIRTTALLHILEGEIYWLTHPYNTEILPEEILTGKLRVLTGLNDALISTTQFDLVINLEEDIEIARLVSKIQTEKLIGVFEESGQLKYTAESAYWFDMSLISVYGSTHADNLKKNNKLSYQEILYDMLGKKFSGQKYIIRDFASIIETKSGPIGLEQHAGSRWPNKKWFGYEMLARELESEGIGTIFFQKKQTLTEYIATIRSCSYIVTGDTLAMHIALACDIPTTAIFTCTSPDEIYDYGILKKVISKKLNQFYYKTESIPEAREAISVKEVLSSIPLTTGPLKSTKSLEK